jgi:hypothetical protein
MSLAGSGSSTDSAPRPLYAAAKCLGRLTAEAVGRFAWACQNWRMAMKSLDKSDAALAAFYEMQKRYRTVLGSYQPLVLRSSAGRNASWYRVRIGADTRNAAERLCSSLRAVGGSCLVQLN